MQPAPLQLKANWSLDVEGLRQHYLVEARLGGRCVGRAHGGFEPGGAFVLKKIEIDRRERSKGHGSALIAFLRAKAREAGCAEFVIDGVRGDNAGAIRLYESLGAVRLPSTGALHAFVIAPP